MKLIIKCSEMEKLRISFPESDFYLANNILLINLLVNHVYNDFRVNEVFQIKMKIPQKYPLDVDSQIKEA